MKTSLRSPRGSALIVAMLFTLILAALIGTYYSLSLNSYRLTTRAFHATSAMNVAELGVEEAMWSVNNVVDQLNSGTGADYSKAYSSKYWSWDGSTPFATMTDVALGGTAGTSVRVMVANQGSSKPIIVSRGVIDLPGNTSVEKWVEVTLSRSSRYKNGLLGRDGIDFDGKNPVCDSWDSSVDPSGSGKAYSSYQDAYNADLAKFGESKTSKDGLADHQYVHDKCPIATTSITAQITVDGATVFGSASVAADSTSAVNVGPQGAIGPYGTADGEQFPGSVSTDYKDNIDLPVTPTPLPAATNPVPTTFDNTSTTADSPQIVVINSGISNSTGPITVKKNTHIVLVIAVSDNKTALNLTKNSGIILEEGASLDIYTAGDVSIAGLGIANNSGATGTLGSPSSLRIFGTSTKTSNPWQNISVSGNGSLSAVVDAPNALVTMSGGGSGTQDVLGAYIGRKINIAGNSRFHYDEALAKGDPKSPYSVQLWRELLTAADRATYTKYLTP
ncbi:hypothetical protein DB347_12745 [Opitutaceae bacterium EW11]|nr:hypothetical protein DB347_12745 [Opitutaceae bacterium EW11]